jgi:hypothetical protein
MTGSHIMTLIACGCVSLSPASMAEPQCHSDARYHIVVEPYPEDAGNRFAVTRLKGATVPACRFDASRADVVIGERGDPLWYGELAGDSLILTRSTGPQGDLVVYDLMTAKPDLDVPSDEYERQGNVISFWQRMAPATSENCPSFAENEANGLGSVTAVRRTFDLATKAVSDTGESKCVAVQ